MAPVALRLPPLHAAQLGGARGARRRGGGDPPTDAAGQAGRQRAEQVGKGTEEAVLRDDEDQDRDQRHEPDEHRVLTTQEGHGALLDGRRKVAQAFRARLGGGHLAGEEAGHEQAGQRCGTRRSGEHVVHSAPT
jgi:hypothetical protein